MKSFLPLKFIFRSNLRLVKWNRGKKSIAMEQKHPLPIILLLESNPKLLSSLVNENLLVLSSHFNGGYFSFLLACQLFLSFDDILQTVRLHHLLFFFDFVSFSVKKNIERFHFLFIFYILYIFKTKSVKIIKSFIGTELKGRSGKKKWRH